MNNYITVTQLTRYIKFQIDNDRNLREVYLKGEISNFKAHSKGHFYFTIKDENSRINAIMFSSSAKNVKFKPQDGMKVLTRGRISVFEATGAYQIYVEEMTEDGLGDLHIAFEQLKEKLSKEGLFDEEHKKKVPKIPEKVGVITAPTGAAIKDILSTIKRRFPMCEVILFPSLVQGETAKEDIVRNIKLADSYNLDTIILGRGGGSIEDLWAFNEEIVARAIYDAKTPIISAVGHEIDFTISDFVADLRAETPTGAAERAVPNLVDVINFINQLQIRANKSIYNLLQAYTLRLNKLKESYTLKNPMNFYQMKEQHLDLLIERLNHYVKDRLYKEEVLLDRYLSKLTLLNPLNSLKRGYAIVRCNHKSISDTNKIKVSDKIEVEIVNGKLKAEVCEVIKND